MIRANTHRYTRTRLVVAIIGLLLFSSSASAEEFNYKQFKSMVDSGQADAAYRYAQDYVFSYEGNVAFDYYYGIAAIDSGHASDGVFALERVLAIKPGYHAARLELARGYFVLEEFQRSREEFELVLADNPPKTVRLKIERYLRAIRLQEGRYKTTSGFYVETTFGADTNANGGPSNDSIFIPLFGLDVTLDGDSVAQEDVFATLATGAHINSPFGSTPGWSYFAGADFNATEYAEVTAVNTQTINLNGGVQKRDDYNRYRFSVRTQNYQLAGEPYRNLIGLGGSWDAQLDQRSRLQVYGQFSETTYDDVGLDYKDASNITIGTGYSSSYSGSLSPVLFTSAYIGIDEAKDDSITAKSNTERNFLGLKIGNQITLDNQYALVSSASYQLSEYAEEDITFGEVRSDQQLNVNLLLNWLINKNLTVKSGLLFTDNQTNIETSQYQRTQLTIGLRYSM